jgi:hypothetical protein
MLRPIVLATVVLAALPWMAVGQTVKVEFQMGKVTLVAKDAPLRAILNEWSRVGGTKLINPERVTGGPLTLELTAMPERQALDILLRDVGGFMVGPRNSLVPGVSAYDRLLIVSGAGGRAVQTPAPPPAFTPVQPVRRAGPVELPQPVEPPDEPDDIDPNAPTSIGPRLRPGASEPVDPAAPAAPPRGNPFGALPGTARPGVAPPQAAPPAQGRPQNEP